MITLFAYLIMILILTSAFVVIFSKDPIQSVLFLVLVFIMTAVLLLLIGAEFLAILLITVYVGAIAILFLFVVMLLNLRMVEVYSSFYYHIPIGAFVGLLFYSILFCIFYQKHTIDTELFVLNEFKYNLWTSYLMWTSNLNTIGQVLYNFYSDLFIVIGLILFAAMIGVIVLTVDYDYRSKQLAQPNKNNEFKRTLLGHIVWENMNVVGKCRQYPWWIRYEERSNYILPNQTLNWDDPIPEFKIPQWAKNLTFGYLKDE